MNELPIRTSFAVQLKGLTDAITGEKIIGASVNLKILRGNSVLYETTFMDQGNGNYLALIDQIETNNGDRGFLYIEAIKTSGGNEFRLTIKRPVIFRFLE